MGWPVGGGVGGRGRGGRGGGAYGGGGVSSACPAALGNQSWLGPGPPWLDLPLHVSTPRLFLVFAGGLTVQGTTFKIPYCNSALE